VPLKYHPSPEIRLGEPFQAFAADGCRLHSTT